MRHYALRHLGTLQIYLCNGLYALINHEDNRRIQVYQEMRDTYKCKYYPKSWLNIFLTHFLWFTLRYFISRKFVTKDIDHIDCEL